MLPADVEIQLISRVKEKQDSDALMEIVAFHTGAYMSAVNKFSLPPLERQELIEHKDTNIYSFIMDYEPEREMKLSSYIYQSVKYKCLNIINDRHENVEISEDIAADENCERSAAKKEYQEVANYLCDCASEFYDARFVEIFRMRHLSGNKKMSWRKIAKHFGLSYEGVRLIYNRNIEKLKEKINKETLI